MKKNGNWIINCDAKNYGWIGEWISKVNEEDGWWLEWWLEWNANNGQSTLALQALNLVRIHVVL